MYEKIEDYIEKEKREQEENKESESEEEQEIIYENPESLRGSRY